MLLSAQSHLEMATERSTEREHYEQLPEERHRETGAGTFMAIAGSHDFSYVFVKTARSHSHL